MEKKKGVILIIATLLFVAGLAQAVPITIQITGIITEVGNAEPYPYEDTIYAGLTFTGTYTYDSETANSSSSSKVGYYHNNSPYGFDISIGGFDFKTAENDTGQFEISIYNDYSLQPYDNYRVESSQNEPLSTGLSVNNIVWSLNDITHTALSSNILPSDAPNLDDGVWSTNRFFIACGEGANAPFVIYGTITEAIVIPEPLTVALMAAGALLIRRRR